MRNKKYVLVCIIVLIIILSSFIAVNTLGQKVPINVSYVSLNRQNLQEIISAKGIVESVNNKNVYTVLEYPIESVNVEVGDAVQEGEVLCALDTNDLELSIEQMTAELDTTQKNKLNQLNNNQRLYSEIKLNIESGSNADISEAASVVSIEEVNLKQAQNDYNIKLEELHNGTNEKILLAKNALNTSKLDLESKQSVYNTNVLLFKERVLAQKEMELSETALSVAKNEYENDLVRLANAESELALAVENLKNQLMLAETRYNNAVDLKNTASSLANQELKQYANNVLDAEIAVNDNSQIIKIRKMQKDLQKANIKAPISGVVTAVYANEGEIGKGLLFVIENTNDLEIVAKVKEYDVGKLEPGMPVIIRSDATGSAEYEGEIDTIAPASIKGLDGKAVSLTDVEFEVYVKVTSEQTNLKIGMNTKLDIVINQKNDIYCVPFEAITKNKDKENIVYVIVEGEKDGGYVADEIAIELGLESDFLTEISGDELRENMKIVSDAAAVGVSGQEVNIQ